MAAAAAAAATTARLRRPRHPAVPPTTRSGFLLALLFPSLQGGAVHRPAAAATKARITREFGGAARRRGPWALGTHDRPALRPLSICPRGYSSMLPAHFLALVRGGLKSNKPSLRKQVHARSSSTGPAVENKHTLEGLFNDEEIVKKSRFITHVAPVTSIQDFEEFLTAVRDDTASHNCWAWKIGGEYRFSDDGEPSGTAGKPILQAIEYSGLHDVAVVVTRFFGGIKLGAGGLVRAYGGSASNCLRKAPRVEVIPMSKIDVACSATFVGTVYRILKGQENIKTEYCEDGSVVISAHVPSTDAASLSEQVRSGTQARAQVSIAVAASTTSGINSNQNN